MKIYNLLKGVKVLGISNGKDVDILSLHYRSSEVKPGSLFFALKGLNADGHDYLDEAFEMGAVAAVVERGIIHKKGMIIRVEDTREAMGRISASFYGNPSKNLKIIGVTGTNGKTTTTYLIESILKEAGFKPGVIGTINFRHGDRIIKSLHTTPESVDLQRILKEMRDYGVTHVIMEVSSHGISLKRVEGCHFDIACFTSFSQDHLDFHGDLDEYFRAKALLFTHLLPGSEKKKKWAILNADDNRIIELESDINKAGISTIPYGISSPSAKVRAMDPVFSMEGIRATISGQMGEIRVNSPLVGWFNLSNMLCAYSVSEALGIPPDIAVRGLEKVKSVPGRMEIIRGKNGETVFVDYAHTPDALRNALETIRRFVNGRLILIFGCGGERDRTKRPIMGEIGSRLADILIITSDNPRMEEPIKIIEDILVGVRRGPLKEIGIEDIRKGMKGYVVIEDRKKAIRYGVSLLRRGDILLIAGKGHENYQIIGRSTIPFDDRVEAKGALIEKEKGELYEQPSHEDR